MLLSQIEAFLTVAERRSVSSAAAVLYVTQPALTTRIKKLERELGIELFVRTGRGMRLTAEGRAFRPHAQRALEGLAEGRAPPRAGGGGRGGGRGGGAAAAAAADTAPRVGRRVPAGFPNGHRRVRTRHTEGGGGRVRGRLDRVLCRVFGGSPLRTTPDPRRYQLAVTKTAAR